MVYCAEVLVTDRLILAVDAMGGDNAPDCVIEGIKLFLKEEAGADILLFGPEEQLKDRAADRGEFASRVRVEDAPEEITMHDEPMMAVRRKQNSSLVRGLQAVRDGRAQAFVSAGSTGAIFIGSMVTLRMLKGISRPALGAIFPGVKKPFLVMDCGANADCQAEYLRQFGLMGSVYMQKVLGVSRPCVALVNIGAEEEKGSKLYKEAHQLMKNQSAYDFTGNIEARDIQQGDTDVVVCDGFTGNIILKYAEGLSRALFSIIKGEVMKTTRGKIGGALLKPAFGVIKQRMNPDQYGGAPLLGVNGAVVKAHGSSGGYAFSKALEQAAKMVRGGVVPALSEGLNDISRE